MRFFFEGGGLCDFLTEFCTEFFFGGGGVWNAGKAICWLERADGSADQEDKHVRNERVLLSFFMVVVEIFDSISFFLTPSVFDYRVSNWLDYRGLTDD